MPGFITKLQKLSDANKKIFLAVVIGMFALILGFFWVTSTARNITKIGQSLGQISFSHSGISDDLSIEPSDQTATALQQATKSAASVAEPDTKYWRPYQSPSNGFSFQYPPDLTLKEATGGGFTSLRFSSGNDYSFWLAFAGSDQEVIVRMINPKSSDWSQIKNGSFKTDAVQWKTLEEINNGTLTPAPASSLLNVYTQKDEVTYIFQCVNCNAELFGQEGINKQTIFEQMVSSFEFIPPS